MIRIFWKEKRKAQVILPSKTLHVPATVLEGSAVIETGLTPAEPTKFQTENE